MYGVKTICEMRINCLKLKSGKQVDLKHKITVFVGPNNSGKSQTLKDIRCLMDHQQSPIKTPVILADDNTCFEIPNLATIQREFAFKDSVNNVDHYTISSIGSSLFGKSNLEAYKPSINSFDDLDDNSKRNTFISWFGKYYIALMDAETRLKLSSETSSFVPQETEPDNLLQSLFIHPDLENELRQAFKDAFHQDIKLDVSQLLKLCIRVGENVNEIPADARIAYNIAKDIPKIDSQGDGYRSFAGIVIGLLICKNRIILLDEPEAFLHPAQAFFLGKWIGTNSAKLGSQLLVCTHSSNFLSGILAGTQELDVIRLNRIENNTQYITLTSDIAKQLVGNPILSSQRVIEGIFHKGVVICEADADRAVYQSVAAQYHKSNREILFIHAHNKQTLAPIAKVMKATGTPVAVVSDIDIFHVEKDIDDIYEALAGRPIEQELKDRQMSLANYIESRPEEEVLDELKIKTDEFMAQLNRGEHTLDGARTALKRIQRETTKWSAIKRDGIKALNSEQEANTKQLIDSLKQIGLFVVPVGELEGWIDLGTHKKNKWIIPALETIYDQKTPEDLARFIGEILQFFR